MRKQILTMMLDGEYKVIYDSKRKYNPFCVYHIYREPSESGCHRRQKLLGAHTDYANCMIHLLNVVCKNNKKAGWIG